MNTLISTIIISSILLAVVSETSYSSFFTQANILRSEEGAESAVLVDSCFQIATLWLTENSEYRPAISGDNVTIDSDICKILFVSPLSDNTFKIKTSAQVERAIINLEKDVKLTN